MVMRAAELAEQQQWANNRTALNEANVNADRAFYTSPTSEQSQALFRQMERDYRQVTDTGAVIRAGDALERLTNGNKELMGRYAAGMGLRSMNGLRVGQSMVADWDMSAGAAVAVADRFYAADGRAKAVLAETTANNGEMQRLLNRHEAGAGDRFLTSYFPQSAPTSTPEWGALLGAPRYDVSRPILTAYDPRSAAARAEGKARAGTALGLAVAGPVFGGLGAGAQLAGAPDAVVNNIAVAQTGLVISLAGVPAPGSVVVRPANMPTIPQGLTAQEFQAFNESLGTVMRREGLPPGQTIVQGSRAAGRARSDSDIDVIHIVAAEDFELFLANRLSQVKSEKISGQILKTASKQDRLTAFQISNTFERGLWTDVYPGLPQEFSGVQFSLARGTSSFLNGPLIPLGRTIEVPQVLPPLPPLPSSSPRR